MAANRGVRRTRDRNEARCTVVDPATMDIATKPAALRTVQTSLELEHAKKIGRALDDADEDVDKKTDGREEELGKALERARAWLGVAGAADAPRVSATQHASGAALSAAAERDANHRGFPINSRNC